MNNGDRAPPPPASSLNMADLAASLPNVTPGAVNALKDKLQHLAGQQSTILESLSAKVRKRVSVLQEIQKQHDEFEAKFREEKAALEAKYQKLYDPLYNKRYDIVNGHLEVEGVKDEASQLDSTAERNKQEEVGVPEFWLTAMKTNEVVGMQITERDEGALKYLKDIRSSKIENPKGFKLEFHFATNPYFKNEVLTKTYHMIDDDDEPILERAIGTVIQWHPGKNATEKLLKKKPKKGAKNAKPITKTEKCESFFNFFDPPEVPDDDDDIDQDVAEQLQDSMEQDYDVGATIRDRIIPHAVSWFTGEALQGEEFEDSEEEEDGDTEDEDDEEEDEGEEEDEEEEDDDDDDEEEDEGDVKGRKVGQKSSKEQPPQCKQQ